MIGDGPGEVFLVDVNRVVLLHQFLHLSDHPRDRFDVLLVFFNFFTVAHDVLDLGRVHLFGPAALGVREAAVLEMGLLRVGLMYDGWWKEGRGEFRVGGRGERGWAC